MGWYYDFRPYVSVAERQRNAQRELAKLAKRGLVARPVAIEGRTISRSFWGKSWCDNLESYMDFANRLPRGRTYVRNGSVVHLEVKPGAIEAMVSGSELYKVKIDIVPATQPKWQSLCQSCAGAIGSMVELLQGRFSNEVMRIITEKSTGLFPSPKEIKMDCSCPDSAGMCKHIAAVLYGVGARLDHSPELLFVLRSVNHEELITQAASATDLSAKVTAGAAELAESDISAVFGIELDSQPAAPAPSSGKVSPPTAPPPAPKAKVKRAKGAKLQGTPQTVAGKKKAIQKARRRIKLDSEQPF